MQVGPESAGATPGPIAYGRGGVRPTITDANLVLGRLNPAGLLAVGTPVPVDQVRQRIGAEVGDPLGLDVDAAAAAILRIANDRMAGAIRMVSLSKGHDPRDFALFAFGGAGPLHAVALARELGIPRVLILARPGITNALGCIVADLRHDFVRTVNRPIPALDEAEANAILAAQAEEGRALIAREGVPVEGIRILRRADMQFQGQSHMLSVELSDVPLTKEGLAESFATAYWRRFEVELAELRPVLVNLHTAVIGVRPAVALDRLIGAGANVAAARTGSRPVWFEGGFITTPIYAREKLPRGARFEGPAILEQLDATTVVEPGNAVEIDRFGNLIITV